MEQLLKSGIINLSELASRMWPERSRANASALLRNKLNGINGNKLTVEDNKSIKKLLIMAIDGTHHSKTAER